MLEAFTDGHGVTALELSRTRPNASSSCVPRPHAVAQTEPSSVLFDTNMVEEDLIQRLCIIATRFQGLATAAAGIVSPSVGALVVRGASGAEFPGERSSAVSA